MKLKKIAARCKDRATLLLWDVVDKTGTVTQWVSNGAAAWPLFGLPIFRTEELVRIFDISDKRCADMRIEHTASPATLNFSDYDAGELIATEKPLRIVRNGDTLIPLAADGRILLIDSALAEPIMTDGVEFYLRLGAGEALGVPYFAAKAGLVTVALIMPYNPGPQLKADLTMLAEHLSD